MDDTCCILRKGDVDGLLHHLNNICPTIKLTMEVEEGGSLPFLRRMVNLTSLYTINRCTQLQTGTAVCVNLTKFELQTERCACVLV